MLAVYCVHHTVHVYRCWLFTAFIIQYMLIGICWFADHLNVWSRIILKSVHFIYRIIVYLVKELKYCLS